MPNPLQPTVAPLATAAGAVFEAVSRLRGRAKPLHPRGVTLTGVLRRQGADRPWGAAWLDEPAERACVVRISRSAGLPEPLPDVVGLSVRVSDPQVQDLLMATAGSMPGLRHLLLPRTSVLHLYSTLLPYTAPRGPAVLGALPQLAAGRRIALDPHAVADAVRRAPLCWTLAAAAPTGAWEPYGSLEVTGLLNPAELDPVIDFDPVLHPLAGLTMSPAIATIRAGAYAGARAARR